MKKVWLLFTLLILASFASADAFQMEDSLDSSMNYLKDWHIAGQNMTRYDLYDDNGYKQSSTYPYDSSQVYNESRLSFDRQFSPYESFSLSSSGLLNDSQYRSTSQGWIFEDIRSTWEKGNTAVPFRANLGDYTSNLSYRTIQQNLKGTQIELQPNLHIGSLEQRHSFIGFFGMQQTDYRNFDFNRNSYAGGSWLVDLMQYGVWAVHYVDSYRDKNVKENFLKDRNQGTLGFTFEKMFQIWNQKIGIESEVDKFSGDYDSFTSPSGVEEDKSDMGYFLKMNGVSGNLFDYGFRWEEYGDHFRPHGGVISSNRRTLAGKLGGKVYKDIRLDGRLEKYRDRLESTSRLDTNLSGLTLSGPVQNPFLRDLNIYFDTFREDLDSGDRNVNVRTLSYVGQINSAIYKQWNGHLGFNFRNANDDAFRYTAIGREYTADVGHPVNFKGVSGDVRVGTVFTSNSGPSEGYQFGPFTGIALQKDKHRVNLNMRYLLDDSRSQFGQDVSSFSGSGGYTFTYGPHRFSFDFEMYNRNPYEFFKATEDYRLGFSYTFTFDKPAGTDVRDFSWSEGYKPPVSVLERISAESLPAEIALLEGVAPGRNLSEVQTFLKAQGFGNPSEQGSFLIYEAPRVFRDADWRQRLVVEHKDGQVVRSIYILDLDPSQNPAKSEEVYERVRGFLLKRYGNPSAENRQGEFSPNYSSDVNSGRLVRATDWTTQAGQLRFGIPSRFSQPVRMEIQYAPSIPTPGDSHWGLEQV